MVRILIAVVAALIIAGAVYISKQRSVVIGGDDAGTPASPPAPGASDPTPTEPVDSNTP